MRLQNSFDLQDPLDIPAYIEKSDVRKIDRDKSQYRIQNKLKKNIIQYSHMLSNDICTWKLFDATQHLFARRLVRLGGG